MRTGSRSSSRSISSCGSPAVLVAKGTTREFNPTARKGVLWDTFKKHYGPVLGAARPGLMTTRGPVIMASSPYSSGQIQLDSRSVGTNNNKQQQQ